MSANSTHNLPEFSVTEVSAALKRTVEDAFGHVRVRGEISGFKRHSSGHCYLRLKDEGAVLDAVIWKGVAGRLSIQPEEGLEVVAVGRITTYPGRSSYQIVIESLEVAGVGALLKLLEDRRKKLAAEGLFDPARKKKLPFLPRVIGVVTSPTGAVIRDILHRLADRFPSRVLLWPVAVQGDGAAAQIAAAIDGFNRIAANGPVPRPDLLIVARGGGSLEDLWAFNEEIVVRAAAASSIPLISAVGHETDTTLIDFAADVRAPTPTAAAEMAVPVRLDLLARVEALGGRQTAAMARALADGRTRLEGLARGLPDPARLIEDSLQRLDDRAERLANALPVLMDRKHAEVDRLFARLPSPREQLAHKRHAAAQAAARLGHVMALRFAAQASRLERVAPRLPSTALAREVERHRRDLARLSERLHGAAGRAAAEAGERLGRYRQLLESYSHEAVLGRGFALIRDGDGRIVEESREARTGALWDVEFRDGRIGVVVGGGVHPSRPKTKVKDAPPRQGDLF
ncbi:MAG: exodeoxyribonuclease VII large subunit [Alphaproteobacteria bacterium]|nr:exodeoxyribonuclease VII large subunit [Alphaproteobacteria bacterium]MBF0128734.1 exodeoxyribonuclease VII large subunit [Alphaproteobacteria bacterium]